MGFFKQTTSTAWVMAILAAGLLSACGPKKDLSYKEVREVVGLGEDEVRARLGGPSFLTDGGDIKWWTYDGVISADGRTTVSCHVIFKADRVDKVDC